MTPTRPVVLGACAIGLCAVAASRRAANLMAVLNEAGADPRRFVQCWPMRGNRAEVSRAELDSLIAARGK